MKNFLILLCLIFSFNVFAKQDPLPTAQNVDVARYIGKWYTITSLPQFFTRKCEGQTAEYGILSEMEISVQNTCIKSNGKTDVIYGAGTITDTPNNARLSIQFENFWLNLFKIKGEYVIIKLSEGYDSVLVGSTNRKSLWILSRTPSIDPEVLNDYKRLAKKIGFPVDKLEDSKY
ncbi:MAG: lipocalin family protein [Bacteriovorax sp.]|nr:lipocalin family protein [Bacteriovorax sp.]